MAHEPTSRLAYFRDLILSLITLVIGRLLPKLHVPYTDLDGKVAIITGANSGIGLEIALGLTRRGATVYLACRNISKAYDAISEIRAEVPSSKGRVIPLSLDTSTLSSVRDFAQEWVERDGSTTIDLLFHNAGIGSAPPDQRFSSEGFPLLYATNFLGSFLLTRLLEEHLAPNARIIFTASSGQYSSTISPHFSLSSIKDSIEPGFHAPAKSVVSGVVKSDSDTYGNTKAMQVAFAKLLQERFDRQAKESGMAKRRVAHAFSPGFTLTNIFEKLNVRSFKEDPMWWILSMTTVVGTHVSQGAATGVWLGTTMDEGAVGLGTGGGYWDRMTRRVSSVDVMRWEVVERLWVRWEADAGIEWR